MYERAEEWAKDRLRFVGTSENALPSTSVNGEQKDHSSLQERTDRTPAAPLLIDHYLRCAYYPWHASTHGFLQEMATWHIRNSQ